MSGMMGPLRLGEDPEIIAVHMIQELTQVGKVIERVRYLRLRKELAEGENPEINTDKETLLSRMEELGFRKDVVEALQEIDRKLSSAGTPLELKGCMDVLRSIFEKMTEEAAKKVSAKRPRPLPQGQKLNPFQPWRQYLESEGVLTEKEAALAQAFYNYLSVEGAHALGSAPEQVRVSKNMVIELGLMFIGRIQTLK